MGNLANTLSRMGETHALTNRQLASYLGLDETVMSRLRNEKQPIGHGTMARIIVRLSAPEAATLLQAYFEDELERIREGRAIRAKELGLKLADKTWTHQVRVESCPNLKSSRNKP